METPSFLWIVSQVCKAFGGSALRCPSSPTLGATPFIFPLGNLQVFEQINSQFAFLRGPQITQHVCLHSSGLSLWVLGMIALCSVCFYHLCVTVEGLLLLGRADDPGHKAYQPYKNVPRCLIASVAFPVCSVASASSAVVKFPCALSAWQRLQSTLTDRSRTPYRSKHPGSPFISFSSIYIYPKFDFCCFQPMTYNWQFITKRLPISSLCSSEKLLEAS